MADLTIADTPEALTPAWLTDALTAGGHLDGARVRTAELSPVGTGQMCDSLRIALTYDRQTSAPPTLVAKLPAADQISCDTAKSLRSYESEVRFYQQLAPELAVRTPAVFHADIDVASASFVLLLEDLAPAEVGDQLAGCSPERAAAAVNELVGLHAPRWGDPWLEDLEWLHKDPEANRAFLAGLLPDLWNGFRERYAPDLDREVHLAGDELFANLDSYLGAEAEPRTVVHGDYRLDNLLFRSVKGGSTEVAVVDWQTCGTGLALTDVAYCIGASLRPAERQQVEADLVEGYHQRLLAAGVSGYDEARCWVDYRRGTLAGLVMAVAASMLVTRTDRGDQMFLTMADRHARHALDLDAAGTLAS